MLSFVVGATIYFGKTEMGPGEDMRQTSACSFCSGTRTPTPHCPIQPRQRSLKFLQAVVLLTKVMIDDLRPTRDGGSGIQLPLRGRRLEALPSIGLTPPPPPVSTSTSSPSPSPVIFSKPTRLHITHHQVSFNLSVRAPGHNRDTGVSPRLHRRGFPLARMVRTSTPLPASSSDERPTKWVRKRSAGRADKPQGPSKRTKTSDQVT